MPWSLFVHRAIWKIIKNKYNNNNNNTMMMMMMMMPMPMMMMMMMMMMTMSSCSSRAFYGLYTPIKCTDYPILFNGTDRGSSRKSRSPYHSGNASPHAIPLGGLSHCCHQRSQMQQISEPAHAVTPCRRCLLPLASHQHPRARLRLVGGAGGRSAGPRAPGS